MGRLALPLYGDLHVKTNHPIQGLSRITLTLALAAGAPAFLAAALTLAPAGGKTVLQPGETLELAAEQDGHAPVGALEWRLLENDRPVPPGPGGPLVITGTGSVRFVPPVAGPFRTFTIQVRQGSEHSEPLALQVMGTAVAAGAGAGPGTPPRGDPDAMEVGADGDASLAAAAADGAAKGAGAAAGPRPRLDPDAMADLCGWDRDLFKLLARDWRKAAGEDIHTLKLRVDGVSDAEFLEYLRNHPNVRRIEFLGDGRRLSPDGLAAALTLLPNLEALKDATAYGCLTDRVLVAIGANLTELELSPDFAVTGTGLRALPLQLQEPEIRGTGTSWRHADFRRLERLVRLSIVGFRGSAASIKLPPGLKELRLDSCPALRTVGFLPEGLESLTLQRCPALTSRGLHGALRVLEVDQCPTFTPEMLTQALDHLPELQELAYGHASLDVVSAQQAFAAHPSLLIATTWTTPDRRGSRHWQYPAPESSSSSASSASSR